MSEAVEEFKTRVVESMRQFVAGEAKAFDNVDEFLKNLHEQEFQNCQLCGNAVHVEERLKIFTCGDCKYRALLRGQKRHPNTAHRSTKEDTEFAENVAKEFKDWNPSKFGWVRGKK